MAREQLLQIRRGTDAAWTSANPTLAAGEFGFETDTYQLKCGDGTTAWNSLAYTNPQYLTAAEGDAAYQPLDADLTELASIYNATTNTLTIPTGGALTIPAASGGTVTATQLCLWDEDGDHTLAFAWAEGPLANRNLNLAVNGADRTISLSGDLTISGDATISGTNTGDQTVREILTAARTYYVRTDGSNSNTGLADTAGGAFLTIQKAIDVVAALDLSIYNVTIQVRSGTYTGAVVVNGPWIGSGTVTLTGDTGTPANVIISVAGDAVSVKNFAALRISGFKITTTTGFSNCLYILDNGTATITNSMEFGAATGAHIYASNGGNIVVSAGAIAVTGNAYGILLAQAAGRITFGAITVTLTGTPAFTTTVQCDQSSYAGLSAVTFSGGATGTRYSVSSNSVIASDGSGANFIPGNAAGSATTGGQYV
jgi:hypothetical protein